MITGTPNASAIARCSLDMPMSPALPPTIKTTHDGEPDVNPYRVVFKYLKAATKEAFQYIGCGNMVLRFITVHGQQDL